MTAFSAFTKSLFLLSLVAFTSSGVVRAAEKEVVPFPKPMTGKQAPAFSEQGIYGENYTLENLKGIPTVLVFGTSW